MVNLDVQKGPTSGLVVGLMVTNGGERPGGWWEIRVGEYLLNPSQAVELAAVLDSLAKRVREHNDRR